MTVCGLFSETLLAEAAFDLLTSSTLERYIRMATRAVLHAQQQPNWQYNAQHIPNLVTHARSLWRQLLQRGQRDVPEVELALLLTLLAQSASPDIDDLLVICALTDHPAVTWLAALARRLLRDRASNKTEVVFHDPFSLDETMPSPALWPLTVRRLQDARNAVASNPLT